MGKLNIGVLGDSWFNNAMVMKMMNELIKFSEILGL
jgi:hypothetical protein